MEITAYQGLYSIVVILRTDHDDYDDNDLSFSPQFISKLVSYNFESLHELQLKGINLNEEKISKCVNESYTVNDCLENDKNKTTEKEDKNCYRYLFRLKMIMNINKTEKFIEILNNNMDKKEQFMLYLIDTNIIQIIIQLFYINI